MGVLHFGNDVFTVEDADLIPLLGALTKAQRRGEIGSIFAMSLSGGDRVFVVNPSVPISASFDRALTHDEQQVARGFYTSNDDGYTVPVWDD
jgi:hypothetical protein